MGDVVEQVTKRDSWVPTIVLGLVGVLTFVLGPGLFFMIAAVIVSPPVHRRLAARAARRGKTYGTTQAALLSLIVIVGIPVALGVSLFMLAAALGWATSDTSAKSDPPPAQEASSPAPTKLAAPAARSRPAFDIVGPSSPMRPAQDALNRGDINAAIQIYFARPVTAEMRASPEGVRLKDAIQAASDAQSWRDPSAEFAERVTAYHLPQLQTLPTGAPSTAEDLWKRVSAYEEVARVLEENPAAKLSPAARQARTELKAAVVRRQQADFPILRGAYQRIVGGTLFRQDVTVKVSGEGSRTITWTGAIFVRNANIEDAQLGADQNLTKLRFTHSQYRWARGVDDGFDYRMTSPADGAVGYWQGREFHPVD